MSKQFTFSDPGEGLQEAEVLEVHVSDGDTVSDGDVVLTVETDKANTDIPAPFDGTIDEVRVSEGDMVEVDDVLMTYSEAGASADDDDESDRADEQSDSEQDEDADKSTSDSDGQKDKKSESKDDKEEEQSEQENKDKQDTDTQDSDDEQAESQSGKQQSQDKQRSDTDEPVPAAPSTRRLAREKGVDLHAIEPSGPEGRVTAEDVEAAAEGKKAQSKQAKGKQGKGGKDETSPLTPGLVPQPLPDLSQWGETEREPLRSIRRATARNMARSWAQIPHVYHQDIADITALERFRRAHEVEQGKLTHTVLVMKALVDLLKRFPRFNASLDVVNQEIVYKQYFHMGLAVATERGLLVPVIRDVDRKNVVELAAEAADIANKTRNGELSREDMQGGSITVTNPGPMGGAALTPLINHPQVAIVGMGQARLEPVVEGDLDDYRIEPRLRLPLVLGFDHRVNDGADAAQFVTALIETLADPESLLLAV